MTNIDEIRAFVNSLTYGEEPEPITLEDAAYNLANWVADGVALPDGITPQIYMSTWNDAIAQ